MFIFVFKLGVSVIRLLLVAMAWQMFLLGHLIPNFNYLPKLKRDANGSVNMCLKCDSNTRFRFSPSKLTSWATIMKLPNWSILNQLAKLNFKYTCLNQLPSWACRTSMEDNRVWSSPFKLWFGLKKNCLLLGLPKAQGHLYVKSL